jgi:fucose 4-O-acetylase-like acetyltransferase
VLCLSRLIVFFPFFWLGCVLDSRQVGAFFGDKRVRVVCAVVLVAFAAACLLKTRRIYRMLLLFKGRCWYGAIRRIKHCGWVDRLLAYAISTVAGGAFLGVVPRKRIAHLTELGARTLQVYAVHYEVLYLLWRGLGAIRPIATSPYGWLAPLPLSLLLVLLLTHKSLTRCVQAFDDWLARHS